MIYDWLMTTNRATSNYTIRVTQGEGVQDILAMIGERLPSVSDLGDHSISFRATGDDAALSIAHHAADIPVWFECHLTTGLGVHRRVVA